MKEASTEQYTLEQQVERVGVFFEKQGVPPVGARIIGYLLFSNPPQRSFYEIVEFTQASKSSVSNALNIMMEKGVVSYVTMPGDRKRYFQIDPHNWINLMKNRIPFMSHVRKFIQEAIEVHQGQNQKIYEGLVKVEELYAALEKELPKIIANWEKKYQ
uniref:HTH marR-type domain-containing protein n=1 Tax=Roseihalotalea indica TaxID=2867963 RepID=A0AA49GMQ8_9BACT|nr:hypothetical protein K4G66_28240 [Tunicatimonas sp. TK19036]